MAPARWLAPTWRALPFVTLGLVLGAPAAHALRVVNYNFMYYPQVNVSGRNPHFRTVFQPLDADIVVAQEVYTLAGVDSFRTNVLNVLEPGQWLSADYIAGPESNNALFYKPSKVQFLGEWAFNPIPGSGTERYIHCFRLKPVGYSSSEAEFRVYSVHLKAGSTSADRTQRLNEATSLRDTMNAMPTGAHAFTCGDFNMQASSEAAFQKLLESQANNTGRVYDPLNAVGTWNDNASFASIHTQCPSTTAYRPTAQYAGGGVDDRFDMFLPTYNLGNGQGLDLLTSTYIPVGNDGQHLNKSVTDPPIAPEDTAYARALWYASDHLPVRVDIQLPAKITTDASLAFGTVIVGATASQNLSVSNPATLPADALDYSFSPPAGFTAPGGPFSLAAGDPAAVHAIGMSTATSGNKSGNLSIASDAPDDPTRFVGLSGTVLGHAQASLDSSISVLDDTLDFGEHTNGGFADLPTRVHNRGYNALQAKLSVNGGPITGSDRFSIAGGFTPATLAGIGKTYSIHFDDVGAPVDSTYEATLTFNSADEALPGAQPQPDLVVRLRARVLRVGPGVEHVELPSALRFYPPRPNPLSRAAVFAFDLPRAAAVALEVYDLAGRRVATLASGSREAGHHEVRWSAADERGGRAPAGLYFVRFETPGLTRVARLAILP
jgi:hypothetical protein